jgi:hypothetical protein
MRNLIIHPDGRLKTGRLSLILFISLLCGLSLLFYLQKPVDKAVVVVRHIFTAPQPQKKSEPKKPEIKKTAAAKPVKVKKAAPVKKTAPRPLTTAKKSPADKAEPAPAPAPPAPPRERVKVVKELPVSAKKTASLEKTPEKPAAPAAAEKPGRLVKKAKKIDRPETAAAEKSSAGARRVELPVKPLKTVSARAAEPAEEVKAQPEKLISEELVTDLQHSWSAADENPHKATPLMSAAALSQLEKRYAGTGDETPEKSRSKPAAKIDFKLPGFTRPAAEAPSPSVKKNPATTLPSSLSGAVSPAPRPEKEVSGQPPAITVARSEYYKLNQAWRKAGEGKDKNDAIIPLRIENLRSAYNFLQMKPVVIRPDGTCIDLADGRRIPPQSLDRFSATVIEVNDPWEKWGRELSRAGLKPGQKFKVRYYLYDFVRRSVYARVNQAYEWARKQGLIPAATRPSDVDVLGRAYVVKRDGGGAFGVFVPLQMSSRDGRTIRIDPVAFNRAPEIAALRQAGMI